MPTSTAALSSERRRFERHASSGFTLLELAVVLLILGIAASFLAPRLRDPEGAALAASAERLATTARYLYDEAAYQRLPMRLNLDLDHQSYFVTVLGGEPDAPEFVPIDSPLARPVVLPDSVAFRDVVLPAVGLVTEGVVFAQFSPEGWADPLVVHLRGRSGGEATMAIEPLTGRTRVADRYVVLDAARGAGDRRDSDDRRGGANGRGGGMASSRRHGDAAR
ncbi:MAG: prepilin-type N-terminal cleavage/methylation domain-containing protein [Deltaproteobacteria bacterium]|nr:prepilin-type N-terminal cleavage/methylation domain-containing protein [Deltaproteobacteria bacterium]